jgi:hypothetical protein
VTCETYVNSLSCLPSLTICRPNKTEVLKTEREELRWCFGECKRIGGAWELHSETGMSYYDPWWVYKCDGCGQDRRHLG